jgi:hypothetical protein
MTPPVISSGESSTNRNLGSALQLVVAHADPLLQGRRGMSAGRSDLSFLEESIPWTLCLLTLSREEKKKKINNRDNNM